MAMLKTLKLGIFCIQADKDLNGKIDYSEFRKLWGIVTGEVEVGRMGVSSFQIIKNCCLG